MPLESTRASLLERVRDVDDAGAWREFDELYRELILRYALRRGLKHQDAEDVRQSVMLRLAKRLPHFEYRPELGRFRAYLQTTVQNAIHRHLARQDRGGEVLWEEWSEVPSPEGERDADWNEEWMMHHYRRAMTTVRATFQARSLAVFQGLLDGRSGEELALEHDTTTDAVYKIKQRIRDRLRELIDKQVHEEEFRELRP